jgi:hypothetical protein
MLDFAGCFILKTGEVRIKEDGDLMMKGVGFDGFLKEQVKSGGVVFEVFS